MDNDISQSLISAVQSGKLAKVRQLINEFGLSYSQAWSEGYVLLCAALQRKHTDVIELLITSGCRVNIEKKFYITPLHLSVQNGNIKIVNMLLKRNANIDAQNKDGATPLHLAVNTNKMNIIELLLNLGANVNVKSCQFKTPLYIAIERGNLQIIEYLLKHGADYTLLDVGIQRAKEKMFNVLLSSRVHVDANGVTLLHIASKSASLQIVKTLLNNGACVNSTCNKGYSPLHFAAAGGSEDIIKLLLISKADIEGHTKNNLTPLYIATKHGSTNIVKLLLDNGADVNAQDKDGKSILHFAAERDSSTIIEHILKFSPDIENKSKISALKAAICRRWKPFDKIVKNLLQYGLTFSCEDLNDSELLCAAVEKGYLKIVEHLLKCGTDVNLSYNNVKTTRILTSKNGFTALHAAIKCKQGKIASLLIKYRANINAEDVYKRTPIFYAIENSDLKMTKLLLTKGANVKDSPDLLNTAAIGKSREIVEKLLQHGVCINTSDVFGRTALHFAVNCTLSSNGPNDNAMKQIVPLLLSWGANVNDITNRGQTPLHISAERGYEEITKILLNKGADVNAKQTDGLNALAIATYEDHPKIVKVLLQCNAQVDSKDGDKTLLYIAARMGYIEIVHILLEFGADIDARDDNGVTALHIASEYDNEKVVSALLDYGSDVNIMCKNNYTALKYAMSANSALEGNEYDSDSDSYYGCEETTYTLNRHIVMLIGANLYVSEENVQLKRMCDIIYDSTDFLSECKEEVANMKNEKISNNVSVYDILTKSTSQIVIYARNETMAQIFNSYDYELKFPVYASLINTQIRKGMKRKLLLEEGNKIFHFIFNSLPYNCSEKIFSYLSDQELRILIDACK